MFRAMSHLFSIAGLTYCENTSVSVKVCARVCMRVCCVLDKQRCDPMHMWALRTHVLMIVLLARIHIVKEVHKHACENQVLPAGLTTKERVT